MRRSTGWVAIFPGAMTSTTAVPKVFARRPSGPGLYGAAVFFAMSLTPSLLPRNPVLQGVVSGITAAAGYGLGSLAHWLWSYLELPVLTGQVRRVLGWVWLGILAMLVVASMWQHVGWQNGVREEFGMDPIGPLVWVRILPVALATGAVILVVARAIRKLLAFLVDWLDDRLPRRFSTLIAAVVIGLLLWGLWTEVLVNGFFAGANRMFAPRDTATDQGVSPPDSPNRSGSPESLVEWETLGRKGRTFVATGPTVDELNAFSGGGALEPIRVYAGLKSADTVEERARLVLDELERTGAFEREALIVATTTGTGYLEPNAMEALEYVLNGDVATAGVQYSYLPSWISLLADQAEVKDTSEVVFETIHAHWASLPPDDRPELYVYGLSLGSYGVEAVLGSVEILNEPIDGAVLVGPPFVNPLRTQLVAARDPGSTPVVPVYQEGTTVRFTTEDDSLDLPGGEWGDTRIAYVQHASDPVVFFSPTLLWSQPDWLLPGQRGAEISEDFVWTPFVTMWQVALDLPAAGAVPEGFGHLYTREANAHAWIAVTRPDGWTEANTTRLMDLFATTPSPAEG